MGAAFAVWVSVGIAISEINARAAMNFFMTHLLAMDYCFLQQQRRIATRCSHYGDRSFEMIGYYISGFVR
jgi:hypothetical protein